MKIYLLMPVRQADEDATRLCKAYLAGLEGRGETVHFPPRDAPQDDPTGRAICETHRAAMEAADEVHVIWDVNSKGSHFDLGMAYALRKRIVGVSALQADGPEKSYWKAVIHPDPLPENDECPDCEGRGCVECGGNVGAA